MRTNNKWQNICAQTHMTTYIRTHLDTIRTNVRMCLSFNQNVQFAQCYIGRHTHTPTNTHSDLHYTNAYTRTQTTSIQTNKHKHIHKITIVTKCVLTHKYAETWPTHTYAQTYITDDTHKHNKNTNANKQPQITAHPSVQTCTHEQQYTHKLDVNPVYTRKHICTHMQTNTLASIETFTNTLINIHTR